MLSLTAFIENVFVHLTRYGQSQICLSDSHFLSVSNALIINSSKDDFSFQSIPILLQSQTKASSKISDLTVKKVLKFIDGIKNIRKISEHAKVDQNLTLLAISHLSMFGFVKVVEPFKWNSTYFLNENFPHFVCDEGLLKKCIDFVSIKRDKIETQELIRAYSQINSSVTVRRLHKMNSVFFEGADIRRFIFWGVILEFLVLTNRKVSSSP